jgi:MFS family permease
LIAGRAADIWGRKRLFNIGIVMVAAWTFIAGFMKNEIAFYVCRAVSGLASALVASSNIGESPYTVLFDKKVRFAEARELGILAENTVPGRLRSLTIGICISGLPFGGALGFTIAGPMAESLG